MWLHMYVPWWFYGMPFYIGKEDDEKILKESFGNSMEFINSLAQSLKDDISPIQDLSSAAQVSSQVAHCVYEHGTVWGIKVCDIT